MKSDNKLALFFRKIGKRLKEDKVYSRTFYSIIAVLIALIVVIIVSVSCSKKEDNGADNEISANSVSENQTAGTVDYTVPDVALAEDAYADVNALVNQYFAAMTTGDTAAITAMKDTAAQEDLIKIEKESAYIDEFDNIKVYTKPGPLTDSYVAFAYYEIKFKDISTLAPGLTTLYICPREDGSLYICDGDLDDNTTAYIKSVVAQDDVVDLFSMVETKYAEAIDADADLSSFMDNLSAKLDEEVSQAMAQAEGNTEEATDATDTTQEEQPAEEEQPTENVMEEQVTATDTVNVRSSDSENADRIGQIAMGETVTRYEAKENGWSRISYNGGDGYVKSEYLQAAGTADASAEQPQDENQTDNSQTETAGTTSLTAKGKVTIRETVNVRKGELLHLVEEALAQIGAKALAGKGRILGRQHTAQHGHARQHQHHRTQLKNVSLVAGWDGRIHDLCHDQGQQQLTDDLHHDEDGRPDRLPLVALQVGQKQLKQIDHLPFLVF